MGEENKKKNINKFEIQKKQQVKNDSVQNNSSTEVIKKENKMKKQESIAQNKTETRHRLNKRQNNLHRNTKKCFLGAKAPLGIARVKNKNKRMKKFQN